jgi:ABC-type transport system involved in cytochrome c biogenesis permease component
MTATVPARLKHDGEGEWITRNWAVAESELLLKLRATPFFMVLTVAAGLCLLLIPSDHAGYAVLTFGDRRPILPPETSLGVAGLVLAILLFPVYMIALDCGYYRDQQTRTVYQIALLPSRREWSFAARLTANLILVNLFLGCVLILLSLAIGLRAGQSPGWNGVYLFLLATLPSAIFGAVIGFALDRWLGHNMF